MTITLEITPETQTELSRQAAITGRAPEIYAASLLEEVLQVCPPPTVAGGAQEPFGKPLIATFAMIRGLADDVDFSRDHSPDRVIDLS